MTADDTREKILDAALEHFGRSGYDGTSIRAITHDAGVNVASIHYHFGSKEAVLRGVTDRVAQQVNARRRVRLSSLGPEPDAPELIEAFVRSDVEVIVELGPSVAHFLAAVYRDPAPGRQAMAADQFTEIGGAFADAVTAALPHLDRTEVLWRLRAVVAAVLDTFAGVPDAGIDARSAERLIERMVTFFAAGMQAPMPKTASLEREKGTPT